MTVNLQDIAFGVFFIAVALRTLMSRYLANELKRDAPSTWEFLGKPQLYGESSTENLPGFDWNLWTRNNENGRIRILVSIKLACSAVMWMIALAIIMFGDLNRYNHLISGK
jgi:hypothetical protein